MAKMGRPKVDKPIDRVVTVKFREEEYQLIVEYAARHNMTVSQMLRLGAQLQMSKEQK